LNVVILMKPSLCTFLQVLSCTELKGLLEAQSDLQVVGEAENGVQALEQVERLNPNVALMDLRMPIMDGVAATKQICDCFPATKVLVLTTLDEDDYIAQAMQYGATGYLLKDTPAAELANAIRSAAQGYTQLSPGLFQRAIAHQAKPPAHPPHPGLASLTRREREVLSLIATGAKNHEIAEILGVSEKTIKNHVTNILSRLNLHDRTQAAVFMHQRHLT
jgi:DNA-binding NarL/FixJ family response regulator